MLRCASGGRSWCPFGARILPVVSRPPDGHGVTRLTQGGEAGESDVVVGASTARHPRSHRSALDLEREPALAVRHRLGSRFGVLLLERCFMIVQPWLLAAGPVLVERETGAQEPQIVARAPQDVIRALPSASGVVAPLELTLGLLELRLQGFHIHRLISLSP